MIKKIFIVEDEGILILVNTKFVNDIGHVVIGTANNGLDAINLVRKLKPDVILMDIMLKGELDGIETMKEIAKFSSIPAIYITGNSESETFKRAEETNMLAFLTKPINEEILKQAIDKLPI